MILAPIRGMRLGYLALSAAIGVAGVVFGDRMAPTVATEAPTPQSDRVRIEHQIVQIPVIPATTAATPRLKKATGSRTISTTQVVPTRLARSNSKDPFLNRAVQRIVGDGRYTPQPFPRPGR